MSYRYLDSHATTPLDPHVKQTMDPYLTDVFGNPGSTHRVGQTAQQGLEWSREEVARFLNTFSEEIIFTGSATEANNLALRGLIEREYAQREVHPHVITSTIEHSSVLEPLKIEEERGKVEVTYVNVDEYGHISEEEVKNALQENTICISFIYAHNEIGVIQNISRLASIISDRRTQYNSSYPLIHIDAVQAGFFLTCDVTELGVDLLSLSGHKMYGPKGVGALYVRKDIKLSPVLYGGDQEFRLRPGTPNVPAIVGLGATVKRLSSEEHIHEVNHISDIQTYAFQKLEQSPMSLIWNGGRNQRLPNNIHVSIPGVFAGDLMIYLDLQGFAISTGSACHSGAWKPSHVMGALTHDEDRIRSAVRIGLLRDTSKADIDELIATLEQFTSST